MPKFFVDNNQISENSIVIKETDVNHIKNVLRYKLGHEIEIASKQSEQSYLCKIEKILEDEIHCNIIEKIEQCKEAKLHLHILQGLPKSDKMELIIQKCTELGVKEITPIAMSRCIVKLESKEASKKQERWQKIAEVAAKQCGREAIPKINLVHTLKNIYELIEEYDILLVAYEKEEANTLKQTVEELKSLNKSDLKIAILIGPEGGIDEKEIESLDKAKVITLGKRILRTETVAFVMSSILMYEFRRIRIGGFKMATKDMQKELEEKMKLPEELRKKQNKIAMENFAFAIFTSIYFLFLNMGFQNIVKYIFVADTQVFSGLILAIVIILFERAFKKENGNIAIHGIELLILAIITLFVPYIYYMNVNYTNIIMTILIASFNIYYLSKVAIICVKMEEDYRTSLSDVKNIIKKEKRSVEEVLEEEQEKVEEPKEKKNTSTKTKQTGEKTKTTKKTTTKTKKTTEEKPKTTTRKRTTKKKEEGK